MRQAFHEFIDGGFAIQNSCRSLLLSRCHAAAVSRSLRRSKYDGRFRGPLLERHGHATKISRAPIRGLRFLLRSSEQ